jgi:hypothetical protein
MDFVADFAPLLIVVSMIQTALAILKHARAGQWNDVATIGVAVGVGILVVAMLRASDFATGIEVVNIPLNQLNIASVMMLGFAAGSTARTAHQTLKAVDSSQSAKEPKLFPPPEGP